MDVPDHAERHRLGALDAVTLSGIEAPLPGSASNLLVRPPRPRVGASSPRRRRSEGFRAALGALAASDGVIAFLARRPMAPP
jgi:hypothetical protein